MSLHPNPLGSLRLFGLQNQRLDFWLTLVVLALVIASRLLAFPISIWEQDEASFAAAILDFDPTDNRPHPPWFPLWIGMGKLVHLAGPGPAASLQLISLVFSVWIVFPLTALWAPVVGRRLAVGSAVLFLAAPGPWFFSGRAFCGTTATALLIAALACWLHAGDRPRWLIAGSVFGSLTVLVRPQFLPAIIGAALMIGVRVPAKHRLRLLTTLTTGLCLGAIALVSAGGGVAPLWSAVEIHADYHFSRLNEAVRGLADSGLSRSLGHPVLAVAWLVLFHIGMIRMYRQGRWREITPILFGALLPLMVVIYGLSNPAHARYALPVLALTCGLVVFGLERIFRRWWWVAIAGSAAVAAGVFGPQWTAYRSTVSPPVAALEAAIDQATKAQGTLVVDRSLHAFVIERELRQPIGVPVVFDHLIERGFAVPPAASTTMFLFDDHHDDILIGAETRSIFTTAIPLVRTLSQDRFLDLTVATGAALALRCDAESRGPLIEID